jgi:hypothetical protein
MNDTGRNDEILRVRDQDCDQGRDNADGVGGDLRSSRNLPSQAQAQGKGKLTTLVWFCGLLVAAPADTQAVCETQFAVPQACRDITVRLAALQRRGRHDMTWHG